MYFGAATHPAVRDVAQVLLQRGQLCAQPLDLLVLAAQLGRGVFVVAGLRAVCVDQGSTGVATVVAGGTGHGHGKLSLWSWVECPEARPRAFWTDVHWSSKPEKWIFSKYLF
jgi:hypothetical protein